MLPSSQLSSSSKRKSSLACFAILLLLAGFDRSARAAVKVWSGGGLLNGNWSTGANWGGSPPNAGDDLIFPNVVVGLRNTNDFVGRGFSSIILTGSNYVVQGNSLFLTNGLSAQHLNFTNTFNPSITLSTSQTIESTVASATLILGGNISLGSNSLTLNAVGRLETAGIISGNGSVTKNGDGTLVYEGTNSNTYTNLTIINAGTLALKKSGLPIAGALAGNIVVGNGSVGATLRDLADRQIAPGSEVMVNRLATWDMSIGADETIANLTLSGGTVFGGKLTLGGNITTLVSPSVASIGTQLYLDGPTHTFSVARGSANPSLRISGAISDYGTTAAGITKTGQGSLELSGANTYSGLTTIDGTLILRNDLALGASGSPTNGTEVHSFALILVNNVNIGNEVLTLNKGVSFQSDGTSSWAGPITLAGDVLVEPFGGTFTNSGVISGPAGLTKVQSGTLIFSGSSGNTYAGDTTVLEGELQLSKAGGEAIRFGSLTVGDPVGGVADADLVRETLANQINSAVPITINSSGLLDLNNFNDALGPVTFNGGHLSSGTGIAALFGDVTINANTNNFARIDGNISLPFTLTFDVADGNFSPDLRINAAVSGPGGITKTGFGEMSLTSSNSYTGLTTVGNGFLRLQNNFALGATNTGTVVASGAALGLNFGVHVGLEPLRLNGPGQSGIFGALNGSSGSNSWAGVSPSAATPLSRCWRRQTSLISPVLSPARAI